MTRPPGLSVRSKLTLSYVAFLMVAGAGLMAVVWVFLLRYTPDTAIRLPANGADGGGQTFRAPGATQPRRSPSLFIPGRSDLWAAFAPKAATMLALLLLVGLVGGWILAGRMLGPLNRITTATRAAGSGSLSHRIALPGRRDELRELADAFDSMMARLEAHVAEQQRFAANASHELRTPLAITQTLLEVAAKDPNQDVGELVDRLRVVNDRAIDLTEALLVLSRAEQRSFTREPVDLSLVAEEAAEALLPLAEDHGVVTHTEGDVTSVLGSAALLRQLAVNLVHNAIVHNLPAQGSVWVSVRRENEVALLTVENTGVRLTPNAVELLAEPFRRGTERIRADHGGVGLGLAIAQSIVLAHDGTLTLNPRAEGGLRVNVRLPVTRRSAAPARRGHR